MLTSHPQRARKIRNLSHQSGEGHGQTSNGVLRIRTGASVMSQLVHLGCSCANSERIRVSIQDGHEEA
jgi:hypothetical protein